MEEIKINLEDICNADEIPMCQMLECQIDYKVSLNPVMCSQCETVYCTDCIIDWVKRNNSCPMRCKPFLYYSCNDTIIKTQIAKIKIVCTNKEFGCNEGIPVGQLKYHEKNCAYAPFSCPECSVKIAKANFSSHLLENCIKCNLQCYFCKQEFGLKSYMEHVNSCSQKYINCLHCSEFHSSQQEVDSCDYNLIQCLHCNMPDFRVDIRTRLHRCEGSNLFVNESMTTQYLLYLRKKTIAYQEGLSYKRNKEFEDIRAKACRILEKAAFKEVETGLQQSSLQKVQTQENIKSLHDQNKKNIETIIALEAEKEQQKRDYEELMIARNSIVNCSKFIRDFQEISTKLSYDKVNEDLKIKLNIASLLGSKNLIDVYAPSMKNPLEIYNKEDVINFDTKVKVTCATCRSESKEKTSCFSCKKEICKDCVQNCKGPSIHEMNVFCLNCVSKSCKLCGKYQCETCLTKCFYERCKNSFCNSCFALNKHQTRANNINCAFYSCEACSSPNVCILRTIYCQKCDKRICIDCYKKNHPDHNRGFILENNMTG